MPDAPRPADLNALVEAIARALDLPPPDVVQALENGTAQLRLVEEPGGRRLVDVAIGAKRGRVAMGGG